MRLDRGPRRVRRLISLTPLIDVVFILLIFFMLASSFMDWRAITLNTPVTTAGGASTEGAILIRVRADGRVDLNARPVTVEGLTVALRDALAPDANRRVLVQSQASVPLQRLVNVLDQVKAAGARTVSLVRG